MVHYMEYHIHGLSSSSLRSREDTPKRVRSARPATLSCNVNTDLRRARAHLCSYEAEVYSRKLCRALLGTSRAAEGSFSLATKLWAQASASNSARHRMRHSAPRDAPRRERTSGVSLERLIFV